MAMMESDIGRAAAAGGASSLMTFIVGAATGALVALLFAPYSGQQSREKLRDMTRSARERAARIPAAMREAGNAAKGTFEEEYGQETHS